MITVRIEPGICGLETRVRAFKSQRKSVEIAIRSECEKVRVLEDQLKRLNMIDVVKTPINKNPIYEKAGRCNLHSSCPVPCAIIKAAEAELGLALARDVKIVFEKETEGAGHAD